MEKTGKIQISKEADDALEAMVNAVNSGFNGGKVSKSEVGSWIILKMARDGVERIIDLIRKDHFDEVMYLQHVVREMKSAKSQGGVPENQLASLLAPLSPRKTGGSSKAL